MMTLVRAHRPRFGEVASLTGPATPNHRFPFERGLHHD